MRRAVDGVEVELSDAPLDVAFVGDRWLVRTPGGTYSAVVVRQGSSTLVSYLGRQFVVEPKAARRGSASSSGSGEIRAPMPGQIVAVKVQEGQAVRKGETLVVLEAMKTQQPFVAPFDGTVERIGVKEGEQVADGSVLVIVRENADKN